mmetsp:Transcript_14401/g.36846  ORF Transcript_14401/g.36846 Transcript_14401/m.36846 type:complete len:432 (-) Transcript_14401:109-1404(-)
MAPPQVDRSALAGRIQGFGNVNPPPLEEENAKTVAKRAMGRLGDVVGEEVLMTVEDFREKGAVGAVKDAVLDAGDLLVDGVAGVFGWLRGDPPEPEEADEEKSAAAQAALTNGPGGAAYGVSQASPTGGINAVWVMPEEADPATLAELARSQVPAGVQPYQPQGYGMPPQHQYNQPMHIPGGPMIAPYQAPGSSIPGGPSIAPYQPRADPRARPPPFVPGAAAYGGSQGSYPGAMGGFPGAPGAFGAPPAPQPASGLSRVKGVVDQVVKGQIIPGPEVAKRLLSQCSAAGINSSKLGELLTESARRLYLGLDGSPETADASLARILGITDALAQQSDNALARGAVHSVVAGASEELLSLRSSAAHRAAVEPMLRRIGLVKEAPVQEVDLLGEGPPSSAQSTDLLGDSCPSASVDLLGAGEPSKPSGGDLLF